MERVRLFSESTPKRYRLFSSRSEVERNAVPDIDRPHRVRCADCGYETDTLEEVTILYCPVCGSTRFETIVEKVYSDERVSVFGTPEEKEAEFQRFFSNTDDDLELKLKRFSGQSLSKREYQKVFGDLISESELCERGFGEVNEDKVNISSDAFLMSRLFSSIKISITKSLEFDPSVMNCENKGAIIERLGERNQFSPKVITLLKSAHRIPTGDEENAWMEDSGICRDLVLEFSKERKPMTEFKTLINDRYPDAPENVLDLLRRRGVVVVEGDHVKFN